MSDPELRTDPPGTVYGARRAVRPTLPRDPLMRIALATALVGVLLGVFFATGVLGGEDEPVVPAAVGPTTAASGPAPAAPTTEPAPTTPAEPSPTAAATTPPAPTGGPKVFRAAASGLCVGVTDDDPEGADAALADCTGGPEQQWMATPVATDVFTLINAASGKCLDVDGQRTDDGVDVQQWSCNGQPNQQWRLTPTGAGPVLLVAVHSGKCAQVDDAGTEAGDQLEQAPCSGAPEQQWTVG
ncbi:Ricin-type beta-trefoil lectin domain-containing protein [Micromonospora rhizosphaerae]|uniref:Ricin-type beta-trefoil lectin domain-containing protein n=1 Tax=Micromonospora rhizosphaerae TaxID=568872 RepID=A0A1C6RSP9_9ACTN|nr:RICIN domain-containing protein [Micromonospora rhizosphaerae]SCL20063.1 Ricin-type beta-trefoil lectin domain-containing protein [Micromonospora rhizosphaerae]